MTPAGAHCVTIYPLGFDLLATPPLQGLVDPKHQWTITLIEVLYQEQQQYTAQLER